MFAIRKKKEQTAEELPLTSADAGTQPPVITEEEAYPQDALREEEIPDVQEPSEPEGEAEPEEKLEEKPEKLPDPDLKDFVTERGLDEETTGMLLALAIRLRDQLAAGTPDNESLEMLLKAVTYGRDIEHASAEAEIRGRNAVISERLKMLDESDGLPHPGSGNAGARRSASSIFDIAREARL